MNDTRKKISDCIRFLRNHMNDVKSVLMPNASQSIPVSRVRAYFIREGGHRISLMKDYSYSDYTATELMTILTNLSKSNPNDEVLVEIEVEQTTDYDGYQDTCTTLDFYIYGKEPDKEYLGRLDDLVAKVKAHIDKTTFPVVRGNDPDLNKYIEFLESKVQKQ